MTPPDIFSNAFADDPYPFYRIMRDDHPLYFHAQANAYVLSRHADICLALRHSNVTTRSYAAQIEPLLGVTLVQLDGQDHARQRRLLAGPFRADRFEATFAAPIRALADRLIDAFRDRCEVELIDEFITPFSLEALAIVVGLPRSDLGRFREWYTALLRFGINLSGDKAVAQAGFSAGDALRAHLRPLVAACRHAPGPGLLSMLAQPTPDAPLLTDDEIVHFGMLMIFAGGETIEKTLATFIRNLLSSPGQVARLRADRSLLDQALAESLRYTAPTQMVPRRTREAVAVTGGVIPAEHEVICFLGSANRDERRFANPDTFEMGRVDLDSTKAFGAAAEHASFGMGRHFCLGAMMARIEIGIAVNCLLNAMAEIGFATGTPPPDRGLFLRGPQSLVLRFTPTLQPHTANRADRRLKCASHVQHG